MFFEGERIQTVREMILAGDADGRRAALDKLLPMQRADFVELFTIMAGRPMTIRLLDPPLNEFLPKSGEEIAEVAKGMGIEEELLRERVIALTDPGSGS
jgi:pyruvate,orthophosphate dikinase